MKTKIVVNLDWLTQQLVEVAQKANDADDLRVRLSALNSLARLHRIQGRGDRSLAPERLTVHFVHPPTYLDDPTIPPEDQTPLIAGPVQDIIWGPGQREKLGGSTGADPESDD